MKDMQEVDRGLREEIRVLKQQYADLESNSVPKKRMELYKKECVERMQALETERNTAVDTYKDVYGQKEKFRKNTEVLKRQNVTLHKEIDRQIAMQTDEKRVASKDALYHAALQAHTDLEHKVRNLETDKVQTLELLLSYETVMNHVLHKIPKDAFDQIDSNLYTRLIGGFEEAVLQVNEKEEENDDVPHTALVKGVRPELLVSKLKSRLKKFDEKVTLGTIRDKGDAEDDQQKGKTGDRDQESCGESSAYNDENLPHED